jgi:hypothetical protein
MIAQAAWRRPCSSPDPRASARPRWPAAWARACWAIPSRSSRTISAFRTTSKPSPAREMVRRQAQRRPAALFHPPRFRHLRARRPAAPDLHPADPPAQRARAVPAASRQPARLPDRPRGPRQRPGRQFPAENSGGAAAAPDPDHDGRKRLRPAAHHPLARRALPVRAALAAGDAQFVGPRARPAGAPHGAGRRQPRLGGFARPGSLRQAPRRYAAAAESGRRRWRRSAPGFRYRRPSAAARARSSIFTSRCSTNCCATCCCSARAWARFATSIFAAIWKRSPAMPFRLDPQGRRAGG